MRQWIHVFVDADVLALVAVAPVRIQTQTQSGLQRHAKNVRKDKTINVLKKKVADAGQSLETMQNTFREVVAFVPSVGKLLGVPCFVSFDEIKARTCMCVSFDGCGKRRTDSHHSVQETATDIVARSIELTQQKFFEAQKTSASAADKAIRGYCHQWDETKQRIKPSCKTMTSGMRQGHMQVPQDIMMQSGRFLTPQTKGAARYQSQIYARR